MATFESNHEPGAPRPGEPEASESILDTIGAQVEAIDALIGLARQKVQVFDRDLAQGGWQRPERIDLLLGFLRGSRNARLSIIVHDTRWLERDGARLTGLLRLHADAMQIYRTGPEARAAMDPLVIVDARHFLHRFHVDQPRAALAIGKPAEAKPLVSRFEEIWATGEPAVNGSVLGL